ncbi:40S ribosomal protein S30 [Microsporum ferrugineum]
MGKVHGSLARAGKVKSQTPKVSFTSSTRQLRRATRSSSEPQENICVLLQYGGRHPGTKDALAWGRHVEPQEKKKTPKGRAKKRLQYTRRFVNVTMTGGKRKMNPNPGAA